MKLAILIPSIPERSDKLNRLQAEVMNQINKVNMLHPTLGGAYCLVNTSEKFIDGGLSVGAKRDRLVQECDAEYLCFLDDDESVPPNYVEELLRLCYTGKDICTFRSLFKCDTYWTVIDMDLKTKFNQQATPHGIVKRRAWHICPIKSSIAKQFRFTDKNNAEDWEWMERVLTKVKTQAKTNQILHQYNHSASGSAVDEIERQ